MNKKLNIAMFGHKHVLSREGGVEIVVKELAMRMAKLGHRVTCYDRKTRHVSGGEIETLNELGGGGGGVKVVPVWTIERKGFAALTSSFSAAWKAAQGAYDVVHIHAEGPAAMCWLPKIRGKKVIVTIHGLDWARAKWRGFARKYIIWAEQQAVKHADKIIVLSKSMQEYFSSKYGRETVFIPNGVLRPTVLAAQVITEKWGLKKDNYVLFVGRIVPEKGLQYLVEAWKSVKTDKKLVITGGSSDTEKFMNALKKMSPSDIIFTGFQQGKILAELYSNAYIYTLPSDLEGMPMSLLEAMSYGNCCLVSNIAEMTEVVEDKAAIFRHSDADELRKVLQELIDNESRVKKYKEAAADFICQKYKWDDVVERTIETYLR